MQIELPFAGNNKQQSTKINAIIKDLRLIQEYARPTVEERLCAPKNLRELGNLLKAKNCTLAQTKEQREQGQDWLQQKGVDLSPLVDKVRTVKEYNYKHKEQRKVEQDSYFYFP